MKFGIHTLDEIELYGKTVLCRIDIAAPADRGADRVIELERLHTCVPTILELADEGARVVLLVRQSADSEYAELPSAALYAQTLADSIGREVRFLHSADLEEIRKAICALKNGEILFLDNLFRPKQAAIQMKPSSLVYALAPCADLFILDSFADAHQPDASLCALADMLPSAMGRLVEEELTVLSRLRRTQVHPCLFLFGGAKLADALQAMETVLQEGVADQVMVAGIVGLTMLHAAGYSIGEPNQRLIQTYSADDLTDQATGLLERYHSQIILPIDCGYLSGGKRREAMLHALPEDALVTDIGSGTAELYYRLIMQAKTVFVCGAMGIYQDSECNCGTHRVWQALAQTPAYTIVGGTGSTAALRRYDADAADNIDYISSGNTSLLRLLTGHALPAIEALRCAP